MPNPVKDHVLCTENQARFRKYKTRVYKAGQGADLSGMNLEVGDTLPDDSTYDIISARIVHDKDGSQIAVVQGYVEVAPSDFASSPGIFREIHPRIIQRTGPYHYKCKRRFSCLEGQDGHLEQGLYNSVMPGFAGKYAPICEEVQRITGYEPNRVLVVAEYETQRTPGEATVRLIKSNNWGKIYKDINGETIEGPDPDDNQYLHRYEVVAGSNVIPSGQCGIILSTAYDKFNLSDVMSRVGCVNDGRLFNLRAGSLLLLGSPDTHWWPKGKLWYIDYQFAYSGAYKLWNDFLKVRKFVDAVREFPIVDVGGAIDTKADPRYMTTKLPQEWKYDSTKTKASEMWTLLRESPIEDRESFYEADFSELDGWVAW